MATKYEPALSQILQLRVLPYNPISLGAFWCFRSLLAPTFWLFPENLNQDGMWTFGKPCYSSLSCKILILHDVLGLRKDIVNPNNIKNVRDNLSKGERLALRQLKNSDV